MDEFKAALPKVIKWSVGENKYDQDGKFPRSLSLFIPLESAYAFANYVMALADQQDKIKTGRIWDYDQRCEVEVEGVYISAKGKEGGYGDYGNINPTAISQPESRPSFTEEEEVPF